MAPASSARTSCSYSPSPPPPSTRNTSASQNPQTNRRSNLSHQAPASPRGNTTAAGTSTARPKPQPPATPRSFSAQSQTTQLVKPAVPGPTTSTSTTIAGADTVTARPEGFSPPPFLRKFRTNRWYVRTPCRRSAVSRLLSMPPFLSKSRTTTAGTYHTIPSSSCRPTAARACARSQRTRGRSARAGNEPRGRPPPRPRPPAPESTGGFRSRSPSSPPAGRSPVKSGSEAGQRESVSRSCV